MSKHIKLGILATLLLLLSGTIVNQNWHFVAFAQQNVSPTPLRVQPPTRTPIPTDGLAATELPTFTPSPEGPVQLRVAGDSPVNVRSLADVNSDQLGQIIPEETYTVLGRFFMWYQIRFDSSPNGQGWVFGDLVEIIGDVSEIPDLSVATPTPALDAQVIAATETQTFINNNADAQMTATAEARVIAPPGESGNLPGGNTDGNANSASSVLPTYTYPPNVPPVVPDIASENVEATATPPETTMSLDVSDGVAPIVPIVILTGIGLIGLLLSSLRR